MYTFADVLFMHFTDHDDEQPVPYQDWEFLSPGDWEKRNDHFLYFIKTIPLPFMKDKLSIKIDSQFIELLELFSLFKRRNTYVTLKSLSLEDKRDDVVYWNVESLTMSKYI